MKLIEKKISFYKKLGASAEDISLSLMLEAIRTGAYKDQIEELHSVKNDKEKYGELKKQFSHFTPSGTFKVSRSANNLSVYNSVIVLDIDKAGDVAMRIRDTATENEYTLAAFIGLGGDGVKILVKTSTDEKSHIDAYNQIAKLYEEYLGVEIDNSGKDISKTCFVSYDPELYYNETAIEFQVTVTETPEFSKSSNSTNIQDSKLKQYEIDTTEIQPFGESSPTMVCNVFDLIKRNQKEPSYNFIWNGIKESSFGYVYGPPKVGKTILCENLGMAIAAGHDLYLGIKIDQTKKRKVLFIGMEEFWRNRAERNQKQLEALDDIDTNNYPYLVVDENFPGRFLTKEDWAKLDKIISEHKPDVVFIDSMTRTVIGEIEDSSTSRDASFRLRELVREYEIALIMIHHTTKLHGNSLDIDKLAGSRVIAQEADFMYGINKEDNKRYLKEVATRYKSEDENVVDFKINENLWLEKIGESQERVFNDDMRRNPKNEQLVFDKILQYTSVENPTVKSKIIIESFEGIIAESEVYRYMKNLEANNKILRGRGFVSRA